LTFSRAENASDADVDNTDSEDGDAEVADDLQAQKEKDLKK